MLTIERNLSLEVLGPPKSRRTRRLTFGATTAAMIRQHFDGWAHRLGDEVIHDWVFAPDYRRAIHARANLLSHRFVRLRQRAGLPDAALHRLRHAVATALVEDGRSSRLKRGSATATQRQRCATTPMPPRSTTTMSPMTSTVRLNEASG